MAAILNLKVVVDKSEFNALKATTSKGLTVKVKASGVKGAAGDAKELNKQLEKSNSLAKQFGSALKTMAIQATIRAVISSFKDAFEEMKKVDTEIINIKKVSNQSEEALKSLSNAAYEMASQYGVAASELMASVYEFTKAGYEENASQMAELATKTMLVGDTTADVADKFIIVADTAWKLGGDMERLNQVVDEADYINNNYATTLDKLADAFPRTASVASMAGMTIEETMAALGTIQAATQETGTKTGTALRALIMNILGDTSSEVEDGVVLTQENIESLREVLNEYAGDVVNAAEATGTLINPMEALNALAEAYNKGLMSDADLFKLESSLGGKLRANQLDALLKNWDMYNEMLVGMGTSAGIADAEVSTMLESWESKTQILKNTWTDFVQKSLSTDMFKGVIDGVTNLLGLFGNLGNMLITISGIIATFKLPSIISAFTKLGTNIKAAASSFNILKTGATGAAAAVSTLQIAIGLCTVAFTAVTMAINGIKQSYAEATDKSKELADAQKQSADNAVELYGAYVDAKNAYDEGTGSKEALATATEALTAALELEAGAAVTAKEKLQELTVEELKSSIDKSKVAITKAKDELINSAQMPDNNGVIAYLNNAGYLQARTRDEKIESIKKAYELAVSTQSYFADLIENDEDTWENRRGLQAAQDAIDAFQKDIDIILEEEQAIFEAKQQIARVTHDTVTAQEGIAAPVDDATTAWSNLCTSIDGATEALKRFNEATETGAGDAYSGYATIYQKFYEDYQKGLKGSTNVKAAIDALIPEDMQIELAKRGVDAADLLASDFYRELFTYTDENGEMQFTEGADAGALLAQQLYEDVAVAAEDGSKVITDANGNIIASFKETEDGLLDIDIKDLDALSEVLFKYKDIVLDPDLLAAWFAALGQYDTKANVTAKELNDLAEACGAVNENGEIDVNVLIADAVANGKTTQEVNDLVDALIEADQNGDVNLDIDTTDAQAAKKKMIEIYEEVIGKAQEYKYEVATIPGTVKTKVEVDTSSAEQKLNRIKERLQNLQSTGMGSGTITPHQNAKGTKNAQRGLSLLGDEYSSDGSPKPELVVTKDSAYIAGINGPVLGYLNDGDVVYNATDTKKILGGRDITGSIPAFGGGTVSGVPLNWSGVSGGNVTPATTNTGGGGSNNNSGGSNSSSSSTSELDRLKNIVELRKSELSLIEAKDGSLDSQIKKTKQIGSALLAEIDYLKKHNGKQKDIKDLQTEYYNLIKDAQELELEKHERKIKLYESELTLQQEQGKSVKKQIDKLKQIASEQQKEYDLLVQQGAKQSELNAKKKEQLDTQKQINELTKSLEDDLAKSAQKQIDEIEKRKQAELDALEEKTAAEKLANAEAERNVRVWNQATGRWEWQANADTVKQARRDEIEERYAKEEEKYQAVIDAVNEESTQSIKKVVSNIQKNIKDYSQKEIEKLNSVLNPLGYNLVYDNGGVLKGIGGIKATSQDEMVLPPELTKAMLSPTASASFVQRLDELKYMYGASNKFAGTSLNNIGSQHNGDTYTFGSITLTKEQAQQTSVYELVKLSKNLKSYSSAM